MADINALMSAGETEEAKVAAMIKALRGQQAAGDILSLAPDERINALGQRLQKGSSEGATGYGKQRGEAIKAAALAKQQGLVHARNKQKDADLASHRGGLRDLKRSTLKNTMAKAKNKKDAATAKMSATKEKAVLRANAGLSDMLNGIEGLKNVLLNKDLASSTGALSPTRKMAEMGLGPDGGERQGLTKRMKQVVMPAIVGNLEHLGISPTDMDLLLAKAPIPDGKTEPEAWMQWAEDFKVALTAQVKRAEFEGRTVMKPGDIEQITTALDDVITQGNAMWRNRSVYDRIMDNPNKVPERPPQEQANAQQEAIAAKKAQIEALDAEAAKLGYAQ